MEAKKERFALHLIIYLALVFFFSLLPPIGTITPEGMRLMDYLLPLSMD